MRERSYGIVRLLQYNIYWAAGYPLHGAVVIGDLDEVISLISGSNAETSADGFTPLHLAVREGHKDIVAYLLSNTVGPNIRDSSGRILLELAMGNGRVDIVRLLLCHDYRAVGYPLHAAVVSGNLDEVKTN